MKTFHPIYSKERFRNWYPANKAASILIHLGHTWEDIASLWKIRSERDDEYEQKLLFRYCLIEVKSLMDLLDQLQSLIMTAPVYPKNGDPEWRGLLHEEKKQSKILFKKYFKARNAIYDDLVDIRNKISAHRDLDSWDKVMESWGKLKPNRFQLY